MATSSNRIKSPIPGKQRRQRKRCVQVQLNLYQTINYFHSLKVFKFIFFILRHGKIKSLNRKKIENGENVKNISIQINALNKCVGDRNFQSIDNAIKWRQSRNESLMDLPTRPFKSSKGFYGPRRMEDSAEWKIQRTWPENIKWILMATWQSTQLSVLILFSRHFYWRL